MNSQALETEAAFADSEYVSFEHDLSINQRFFEKYAHPRYWCDWRQFAAHLMGDVAGKTILDYGCGMGEEAVFFAKLGAHVTAVDISPVGIEITRKRADYNGIAEYVDALTVDATHTGFPSNHFDIVHGLGILHHVGIEEGLTEVFRVLRPGGTAVFLEPMGNSHQIEGIKHWIYRRFGRRLDLRKINDREENLKMKDILVSTRRFEYFRAYPYRLLFRLRKLLFPRVLYPTIEKIDYLLLKVLPFLGYYAGAVVIHLRKQ